MDNYILTGDNVKKIWDAMHEDRIWRPMIFICIYALVPGNGDAFSSFTQGCARECTDPDAGGLYPPFGTCDRDPNDRCDLVEPACHEQPNLVWPGSGQFAGSGVSLVAAILTICLRPKHRREMLHRVIENAQYRRASTNFRPCDIDVVLR